MTSRIVWCKTCLNMSTRPRIEFNNEGICNACQWKEEKKTVDWNARQNELSLIIEKYSKRNGEHDCVVPVSGGKDSSYVSYKLKHSYGLNPLTITVKPGLTFEIGERNLDNFIAAGYDNLTVRPNLKTLKKVDKFGLINYGRPMLGWQSIIQAYIPKLARRLGIALIFFGENGEIEYGGSTKNKNIPYFDLEFINSVILPGSYNEILQIGIHKNDLEMYKFENIEMDGSSNILNLYWSYFEPWDSYRNYKVAKDHCGLIEKNTQTGATYNKYTQNDTCLYDLHTYLMYLKFGFGRASQDAGIDIRRGALTRDDGIKMAEQFDNKYPEQYIEDYINYYEITLSEFHSIIDKWANKDLFIKKDRYWYPKFKVGIDFKIN